MNTETQTAETSARPLDPAPECKLIIIMADNLPRGAAANRCAVLATGLVSRHPEILGPNLVTSDGKEVLGFTKQPIVVLASRPGQSLNDLAREAQKLGCTALLFLARAQGMRSYEAYADSVATTPSDQLDVDACLIYGAKKAVNKLAGSLPSLK